LGSVATGDPKDQEGLGSCEKILFGSSGVIVSLARFDLQVKEKEHRSKRPKLLIKKISL
jgi:hypothetical protein